MRGILMGIIVVLLLQSLGSSEASEANLPALVLRLYNTSSASLGELDEMKRGASQIFNHSGIDIEWVPCVSGPRDSAVCRDSDRSRSPTVIFVRLVDAPIRPEHAANQLHRTLLGRANHETSSVAVFYATACEVERTAPRIVTKGEILGHAVAHEIGHLLLATDTHSLMGIMKENYDKDDLFAMGKGHLLFGPDEALVIRKRVLSAPGECIPNTGGMACGVR